MVKLYSHFLIEMQHLEPSNENTRNTRKTKEEIKNALEKS